MKNRFFPLVLMFLLSLVAQAQEFPARPNPPQAVNDLAGVISPADEQALEQKLRAYTDTTSTGFVIVLLQSYNGYDPAEYTFELGNQWGVGQKGKDNGLLITVAVQDRKYFIATGYGLEGSIPDAITRRVGDQYFKPNFREGNYYAGLDQATTYLAALPAGEFKAAPRKRDGEGGGGFSLLPILVIFLILFFIFRRGGGNRRRGYRGGGMFFPPFITFGSGGSSWGSGGGFGGGGGGGFGGFGGGSFGGGGSGGSW